MTLTSNDKYLKGNAKTSEEHTTLALRKIAVCSTEQSVRAKQFFED